jgi:hypothetical protein
VSRWVGGLGVFLAVLLVASPASAAPPDPTVIVCARNGQSPHMTQFQTPTGSTFLGGWAVKGSNASLCFRGVAPAGGKVVATWTTPWSHAGGYTFQAEYDFNTLDPAGDVVLEVSNRLQVRGEPWSPWFGDRERSQPPLGGGSGGIGSGIAFISSGPGPARAPSVRWEWRVVVMLSAPTAIDFSADMKVK